MKGFDLSQGHPSLSLGLEFSHHDPDCDDACDYSEISYQSHNIRKLSDGFILTESAMNAPGLNYQVEKMDGSNHMQMKNDSNMERAIKRIFDDGLDGEYFKTDKK